MELPPGYNPHYHGPFNPTKAQADQGKAGLLGLGVAVGKKPASAPPPFVGPKQPPPPPPPPTTEDLYRHPVTRKWDDGRFALQNEILDRAFQESEDRQLQPLYDEFDHSRPVALFLVGGSGAGKSVYKTAHLLPHHRFVDIDCDAFKEQLPEYSDAAPMPVHAESVDMAKRALQRAVSEGKSFVYDSTGIDVHTIERAAKRAREQGYHIALHYVHCHVEAAVARAKNRKRQVPEQIVRQKHAEVGWAFGRLQQLADHVVKTDTTTEAEKATHAPQ
jgi:predicted kinase